jgi:aspartyl-tRNA synthetase
MSSLSDRVFCGSVSKKNLSNIIKIFGWINRRRDHGKVIFLDVRDRTGIVQVVCDPSQNILATEIANQLRNESSVEIIGRVVSRDEKSINKDLKTGEIEILAEEIKILNNSTTLPFQINSNEEVDEELRLKYRYLDLRRPEMHERIALRHKIIFEMRKFFDEEGFYEIETPILTKNTPEGAREFIVPSRIKKGSFFSLPQSPQLYKQLLMASGLERYFQIAKCFRDEDLRSDRQFEFTQLDIEMSYIDEYQIQSLIERLLKKIFKVFLNIDIETPIKRIDYKTAFLKYGSDKPDLRFDMPIYDTTEIFKEINVDFIKNSINKNEKIGMLVAEKRFSRSELDEFLNYIKQIGGKGLLWIRRGEIENSIESPISKFLPENFFEKIEKITEKKIEKNETLFFIIGKYNEAWNLLGKLRLHLGNKLEIIKNEYNFLWVTDFPLLEYNEDEKRWDSVHHPFTRPCDGWESKELSEVTARAYDIVLNGIELGGGSIRIHEKELQEKIFNLLGLNKEKLQEKFGFLLEAQNYGFPVHGGIALGIDRFIMLIAGCSSIRDVIAFPKTQNGDPLMAGPSSVDNFFLKDYGLKKIE